MTHDDRGRFPVIEVRLRNHRTAVVRPLRIEDGPALGVFYESVPREDFRFYCPHLLNREKAMEVAAAALNPDEVVLVIDIDGAIGGYAWYRWATPWWGKVVTEEGDVKGELSSTFGICIGRPYQGLGAGRLIMARLLEIARYVGPPIMSLTVQLANPRAVKLYQAMGFTIVRQQMRGANEAYGLVAEPEYAMRQRVR